MGWSIKYPLGQNSTVSNLASSSFSAFSSFSNPIQNINRTFGTSLPTTVKIGGTSIGIDPLKQASASLRDLRNTGKQASVDWRNAGRGEIGKFVGEQGTAIYNVAAAPGRALTPGANISQEFQRWYGSLRSTITPLETYTAESPSLVKILRDPNLSKNTLGTTSNFAGQIQGQDSMMRSGTISNSNRNEWQQLSVKAAAVVAAIFGGAALAGAGESGAGGGAAAGAGAGEAGGVGAGFGAGAGAEAGGTAAYTLPEVGSAYGAGSGASAYGLGVSTDLGVGAGLGGAAGGAAAASGGSSWLTWAGISSGVASLLGGKSGSGSSIGDILTGGSDPGMGGSSDGGLLGDIGNLFGSGGSGGLPSIDPSSGQIISAGPMGSPINIKTAAIGIGAALIAYTAYRRLA